MSFQSIPLLTLSVIASGTIAPHRFVTRLGSQAGADATTLGVSESAATVGVLTPVDVIGTTIIESGAAFSLGDTLKSDSSGRGIPWVTSGAKVAVALQAATAAGQFVEVLLLPN